MLELSMHPALLLVAGGLLLAALPVRIQRPLAPILPIAVLALLWSLPEGTVRSASLFGLELTVLRLDALALVWAVIFHVGAALAGLYAWHVRDRVQRSAALIYAGAGVGAVLAGDLVTLFLFWELTSVASVLLIWARRTERAYAAGLRYLLIQVGSGLLLMIGAIIHYRATGSLAFDRLGLDTPGGLPIFLAFGIKCAFPLLHGWMQDAYPEATAAGTVALSMFTTKMAVYALARGYAGEQVLVGIGAVMAVFPVFLAAVENDLRRVLAYSLNSQLGFMVVGVGVGTELALNGAAAHAFASVLYQSLLFMAMGAVLYRAGTVKASELGGLYRSMPWTAAFCIVGAMTISAFPLFLGFATKAMILSAAAAEEHRTVWLALVFASVGVLAHAGIRVPFFSFFHRDAGHRVKEAPKGMLAAMAIVATLCIAVGVYPDPLYALLPFDVDYRPYTADHVITQLQLLLFGVLAFAVLFRNGWYPADIRGINLDVDWLYRRLAPAAARRTAHIVTTVRARAARLTLAGGSRGLGELRRLYRPAGILARTWTTGLMTLWVTVLLAVYLLFYLV